jgi:glucose/arabinose dehydrogenase
VAKPAAVEPLVSGLRYPFDLGFLPDGSALVTERETGRLRKVTPDGQLTEVRTIGEIAEPVVQAGLQGVAVSPSYERDGWIYVYCTTEDATDGSSPEQLLSGQFGRLRLETEAPDGSLWVLTNGRTGPDHDLILRVTP